MKLVPELRFSEFSGEWEEKKLGDIVVVNPKSSADFPEKFDYIDLESVSQGKINHIEEFTKEKAPSRAKRIPEIDDVFFQTVRPYQKNNFIFKKTTGDFVVSTGYAQLRTSINSEYLYNLLLTDKFVNRVLVKSTGSNYPAINSTDLKSITLSITKNEEEQQKIGDFFSKLDRQIELEEQKLEKLEEQKKGYMQKIFSQELRFKDENGDEYPEWKVSKIENHLKERNERSGEGQMLSVTINSGIIKFNELDRKDNSSKDKSNYKVVRKDDIAYNSMRMWQGASGKSDYDGIVSPAYTVIYPTQNTSSAFIEYKFKTHRMIHTFKINSQGLTSDTWNLKYKQLKNINIDMPELKEQERIGCFFKKIDNLHHAQK